MTVASRMQNYSVSSEPSRLDLDVIHGFLAQSYWAKGVPRSVVEKALQHSLCFGVYDDAAGQVGFARMITDRATFAYLADVFILPEHRGQGLSKRLMDAVVSHADLQGLRRMVLATSDAHGLYAQYGFESIAKPELFMEVWHPDIYQRQS